MYYKHDVYIKKKVLIYVVLYIRIGDCCQIYGKKQDKTYFQKVLSSRE